MGIKWVGFLKSNLKSSFCRLNYEDSTICGACLFIFGFQSSLDGFDIFGICLEEMNEFWNSYEDAVIQRELIRTNSRLKLDKIISNDEIFLLRYWDPVVIPKSSIDWSENPFDDWTWQFYYHRLTDGELSVSSYEFTGDTSYQSQMVHRSWIEHNQSQESRLVKERGMTTVPNRILTFIQFWESYRGSSNCQ